MFSDEDITGPNCRDLVFPDGDIAGPNPPHGFRRVGTAGVDPILKYSTDNVLLFWQPPSLFYAVVPFIVYRRRRAVFLRGVVYDSRKGKAF